MVEPAEWERGSNGVVLGGRYRLGPELGRGGHSTVYRSFDTRLTRLVAVKVLRPQWCADPEARQRFIEEQRCLALMDHPGIVRVQDGDLEPRVGPPWVVQALVEGRTLRRVVDDELDGGRGVDVARVVRWVLSILEALLHIHGHGRVHGDVSPRNVMIDDHDDTVVIIDLGSGLIGRPHPVPATAAYAAPERVIGEVVAEASDIYSLGALAFGALAGRPPFEGDDADTVAGLQQTALPPSLRGLRPDVPLALDRLVLATLAKDPADRPDAVALRTALNLLYQTHQDGLDALGGSVARIQASANAPRRRREDEVTPALVMAPPASSPAAVAAPAVGAPVIAPGARAIAARPGSGRGPVASFAPEPGPDRGGVRRYGAVITAVLALSCLGLAGRLAFATDVPARPPVAVSQATSTASGHAMTASPVMVPDVVGLGRDAAAARLRAAGLVIRELPEQDGSARSGLVLAVDPVPGSSVPRGSAVVLVVASGRTTLPDVLGASLEAALSALSREGLAVTWRRVPSTVDGVLAMTPGPGSLVGRGSTVQLVVGVPGKRAPAPVTAGASGTPTARPSPEETSPSPPPSPSPTSSPTPSVS